MISELLTNPRTFNSFLERALSWDNESELSANEGIIVLGLLNKLVQILKIWETYLGEAMQVDDANSVGLVPDIIRILRGAAPVFQDRLIDELSRNGSIMVIQKCLTNIASGYKSREDPVLEHVMRSLRFSTQFLFQLLPYRWNVQLLLCEDENIDAIAETIKCATEQGSQHSKVVADWAMRVLQTALCKNPNKPEMYERCKHVLGNRELTRALGDYISTKSHLNQPEGLWLFLTTIFGCSSDMEDEYKCHNPLIPMFVEGLSGSTGMDVIDCYDVIQSAYTATSSSPSLYEMIYLIDRMSELLCFDIEQVEMEIDRGIPTATKPEELLDDDLWKSKMHFVKGSVGGRQSEYGINELLLSAADEDYVPQYTLETDAKFMFDKREFVVGVENGVEGWNRYNANADEVSTIAELLMAMASGLNSLSKKRCCEYGVIPVCIRALVEHLNFEWAVAKGKYVVTDKVSLDNSSALACNCLCLAAVMCENNPWGQDSFRQYGGIPILFPFMQLSMRATYRECCATLISTLVKDNPMNWATLKRLTDKLSRPVEQLK